MKIVTEHLDIWTSVYVKKATTGRGSNGKVSAYGIQKLRELVLELAVRGKLVPQNPNDEPASVLLEKIADEKERLVKEGLIKKQKKLPDVKLEDTPFYLPENWEWVWLGAASKKITDGTHHSPPNSDSGEFLYISAKNIKNDGVLLSNATYVTREVHDEIYTRCDPELGDILYIKDGATTGITTINNLVGPFSMLSSVALLKLPDGILNTYLLFCLRSPFFYEEMRAGMTGVAITRVTLKKLNNAIIPLPPIEEQHRIVAKVDELMALCDQLEQQQTDSLQAHQILVRAFLDRMLRLFDKLAAQHGRSPVAVHAELRACRTVEAFDTLFTTEESINQLKQTILQLAVIGKLVPQDPNNEPASVYLNKVKKGRSQLGQYLKIRKSRDDYTADRTKYNFPASWEVVAIGEICHVKGGKRVPRGYQLTRQPTPYVYVRVTDMKEGAILDNDLHYISEEVHKGIAKYTISKNDLYVTIAGTIGDAGEVPEKFDGANLTENAAKLIFRELNKRFILLVLQSGFVQGQFDEFVNQMAQPKLALRSISSTVIPLPPVEEQHRIVAKVDELMALCDTLKASIQDAQTTQTQLADAIVQQAVG